MPTDATKNLPAKPPEDPLFGEVITKYTRADALADGELVDVTEWASAKTGFKSGFEVPVAVTRQVWFDLNDIPERLKSSQDVRGRAHDMLWMTRLAVLRTPGDRATVRVLLPITGQCGALRTYRVVIGAGDAGEAVITIMAPGES